MSDPLTTLLNRLAMTVLAMAAGALAALGLLLLLT